MHNLRSHLILGATLLALVGGCNGPLSDSLPTTLIQVNAILTDSTLSGEVKRARLAELGFTPAQIDTFLTNERTANQGGGNLRTAYDKVVNSQLNQLTPDEIQLYADAAKVADSTISFTLSDQNAQAIADLFQSNAIASKDQLSAFLDDPAEAVTIPSTVPDGSLKAVFVTLDPTLLNEQLP